MKDQTKLDALNLHETMTTGLRAAYQNSLEKMYLPINEARILVKSFRRSFAADKNQKFALRMIEFALQTLYLEQLNLKVFNRLSSNNFVASGCLISPHQIIKGLIKVHEADLNRKNLYAIFNQRTEDSGIQVTGSVT